MYAHSGMVKEESRVEMSTLPALSNWESGSYWMVKAASKDGKGSAA
jgi:hypothetical protein